MLQHLSNNRLQKKEQLKLLYEFLASLFAKEQSPYTFTSWLSNNLLYDNDVFDFMVYPSFTTRSYQCNLAFHPGFVDRYFTLDRVYRFKVEWTLEETGNYTIDQIGKVGITGITWENCQRQDLRDYFPKAKEILTARIVQ